MKTRFSAWLFAKTSVLVLSNQEISHQHSQRSKICRSRLVKLGFLWLVVIALDQMRPTSSALGGFQTPLNEFAYVALVFEDVERLRWVERCPVRIEASTI